jgi:hypothetical protein
MHKLLRLNRDNLDIVGQSTPLKPNVAGDLYDA